MGARILGSLILLTFPAVLATDEPTKAPILPPLPTPTQAPIGYGTQFQRDIRAAVLKFTREFARDPFIFDGGQLRVSDSDQFFFQETSFSSIRTRPGILPSDAVNYVFANPGTLVLDCTWGANMVGFKAELEVLGPNEFNRRHNYDLRLAYNRTVRALESWEAYSRTSNGELQAGFTEILPGDFAVYNPSIDTGMSLIPGDSFYFENPGDTSTFLQGWTTFFLGKQSDGRYEFWTHPGGVVETDLSENYVASNGPFVGDYLAALVLYPASDR